MALEVVQRLVTTGELQRGEATFRRETMSEDREGSEQSDSVISSEFFPEAGHGHFFTKKTFHKPTYCHHCTDMLWGLIGQGYVCEGRSVILPSLHQCLADFAQYTALSDRVIYDGNGSSRFQTQRTTYQFLISCQLFRVQILPRFAVTLSTWGIYPFNYNFNRRENTLFWATWEGFE